MVDVVGKAIDRDHLFVSFLTIAFRFQPSKSVCLCRMSESRLSDSIAKWTTLATEKGESGAEAIALEIGAYMGEVRRMFAPAQRLGDADLYSIFQ